jgi:hypothetical protein
MAIQQLQEELTRSIKLSKTNTMTSTEFSVGASDRANKILAFDTNGELAVTQELGTNRGNWATATTFNGRDIVKDSSNNNIYLCNTTHTSTGTTPISSNADVAKWDLIVDAAAASTSANAASNSASNSSNSANLSANHASNSANHASNSSNFANNSSNSANTSATYLAGVSANANASANSASNSSNFANNSANSAANSSNFSNNSSNHSGNAANHATNSSNHASNSANSATSASASAATATTQAGYASSNAATATTQAGYATSNATAALGYSSNSSNFSNNASNFANTASNAANAANAARDAALTAADNFDDVYLGAKSSAPTLDNDGDALTAGDLYYNTVSSTLQVYSGSAWQAAAVSTAGFATITGVETLTNKTLTSPNVLTSLTYSNQGEVRFAETTANGSNYVGFKAPASLSADKIWTLPSADGSANQVLKTDGSGVLSFTTLLTGTSWQSVQTSGFTAVAGRGYPCNTTSSAFTVTLPASPSVGDYVQILDYAGTFDTNNLTINPNSNKLEGGTSNLVLSGDREGVTLTYIDSTQGWLAVSGIQEGTDALAPLSYSIDFLVVAGGGGGGEVGGGGGAGGYRTSTQTITSGTVITVTVGDGGTGTAEPSNATSGSNSSISGSGLTTITSAGGGNGGNDLYPASPSSPGGNGGSGGGGGGSGETPSNVTPGGAGNTPSVSPAQGFAGGSGHGSPGARSGGGGGGSSQAGTNGNSAGTVGGDGGNGTASSITGSSVTYAGGGGGFTQNSPHDFGTGGTGGGGNGSGENAPAKNNGTINLGGGGGGSRGGVGSGNGGKGVVILSLPTAKYSTTITGSPDVSTSGSNTILKFTGSGSYTA